MTTNAPAKQAIQLAGGSVQLAKTLADVTGRTITDSAIRRWTYHGVPAHWVPAVSRITGMPPATLRPDIWQNDSAA